jgi:hypothetical protein
MEPFTEQSDEPLLSNCRHYGEIMNLLFHGDDIKKNDFFQD